METTVQIRQRGSLTFPAELRQKYGIREGDTYRLIDLEGVFVLTPLVSIVPELAREIERSRIEAGLSIEDLLKTLSDEREKYYAQKYGGWRIFLLNSITRFAARFGSSSRRTLWFNF